MERRKYPRISLAGEVDLLLAGVVRNGVLMNLSPSGIQIECRHQLVDQLDKLKTEAGLYPDFELEFSLPGESFTNGCKSANRKYIKSLCTVSHCRRLSQDSYHLGLNFVKLSEADEQEVVGYINRAAVA